MSDNRTDISAPSMTGEPHFTIHPSGRAQETREAQYELVRQTEYELVRRRPTDTHPSSWVFTVDELETLTETLMDFLIPLHDECEHWCNKQTCNADCGDPECNVCLIGFSSNRGRH